MTRWLTLILFSLGVLHASGFSLPSEVGDDCATICGSHSKPDIAPEPSCCPLGDTAEQDQSNDYCPMSDGPCDCGLSPVQDPQPSEPMPMPQRDRDTLPMVRGPPVSVQIIESTLPKRLIGVALLDEIRSGFTHNQLQAILGVWRR